MTEVTASDFENLKKFVLVKEAAKRVSYTPDYIARLAREGKIESVRKDRQWLVELDSLKLFQLQADAEEKLRKKELSKERFVERVVKSSLASLSTEENINYSLKKHALLESAALIMCLSLLVSVAGAYNFFELSPDDLKTAVGEVGGDLQSAVVIKSIPNLADIFWLVRSDKVLVAETLLSSTSELENFPKDYFVPQVDATSGEILIDSSAERDVTKVFSDDVLIQFFDSRSGTVTPIFESHDEVLYPFVLTSREGNSNKK